MSASWSEDDIASILSSAFAPDLPSPIPGANTSISTATSTKSKKQNGSTSSNKPPLATIDVLLTFDKDGVSAHPNHRSLYHGARAFLRALMKDKPGFACPVSLYTLTSTNILRKYVGVLDAPISMVLGAASKLGALLGGSTSGAGGAGKGRRGQNEGASRLLFISSVGDWVRAQKAMVECHRSQMVWFRWGWITLGRYMAVNDLKRERIG